MKSFAKTLLLLLVLTLGLSAVNAQDIRNDKQAVKEAVIKQLVDARSYTFKANYAYPQGGGQRYLTSDYDLKVSRDTVTAYLPYFGVAYFGVPYNNNDGGIKFTSTNFSYTASLIKNGRWNIIIKPNDAPYTSQLILSISSSGFGSLTVLSSNRQSIRFEGYIKQNLKK